MKYPILKVNYPSLGVEERQEWLWTGLEPKWGIGTILFPANCPAGRCGHEADFSIDRHGVVKICREGVGVRGRFPSSSQCGQDLRQNQVPVGGFVQLG